jgi:hypothetical protein
VDLAHFHASDGRAGAPPAKPVIGRLTVNAAGGSFGVAPSRPPTRARKVSLRAESVAHDYRYDPVDARWALLEPRLTAWRRPRTDAEVGGRIAVTTWEKFQRDPLRQPHRHRLAHMPHDLLPWQTVYWYFETWMYGGVFTDVNYT